MVHNFFVFIICFSVKRLPGFKHIFLNLINHPGKLPTLLVLKYYILYTYIYFLSTKKQTKVDFANFISVHDWECSTIWINFWEKICVFWFCWLNASNVQIDQMWFTSTLRQVSSHKFITMYIHKALLSKVQPALAGHFAVRTVATGKSLL